VVNLLTGASGCGFLKVGPEKGDHRSIELLVKACAIKARLVAADLRSDARQFAGTRRDKAEMPRPRDDVIFGLGGERVIDRLREVGVSEDRVVCAAPQLDRNMNIRKAGLSEGRPQGGRSDDRGLMRLSWTQAERGFDDSEPPFLWSLAMRHGQSCGYWAQNSASRFPKLGSGAGLLLQHRR